ncbi:hypothetical protein Bpfe_020154 [Biomphalaria pfeifferi]|uniref:Uncharacterized protein n=1 Tax=Biomphalaria pfeifferi TaxID=112525 RepID=A0AAD8B9N6_BIOPF|nr:hypothetical protein Bpfe_020154 [Biomphalaria pfeifferi]
MLIFMKRNNRFAVELSVNFEGTHPVLTRHTKRKEIHESFTAHPKKLKGEVRFMRSGMYLMGLGYERLLKLTMPCSNLNLVGQVFLFLDPEAS